MERVSIVGSCNRNLEKAQATGLPASNDLNKMLEAQKPDLLDVILLPVAHAATIRTAPAAGIKRIICKKPYCNNLEEGLAIVAEARDAGANIVVHENFRFQPWYRTIKTALDRGDVGDVHQVTFRLRPGDGQWPQAYLAR